MIELEHAAPGATAWRDIPCGLIGPKHVGRTVHLAGWVHRRRDLGGVVFLHLRDRTGLMQLAFNPDWTPAEAMQLLGDLNPEDVLAVEGTVDARPEEAVNPEMATGAVEGLEPALYFALVSFTTLGFGDITLSADWRLMSALIGANGFLIFGWSTAYMVEWIRRS